MSGCGRKTKINQGLFKGVSIWGGGETAETEGRAVVGRGGQERIDLEAKESPFQGPGRGLLSVLTGLRLLLQKSGVLPDSSGDRFPSHTSGWTGQVVLEGQGCL